MRDDRRRPAHYASVRDDRVRRWLWSTVRPYSTALRDVLDRHGVRNRATSTVAAITSLPVTTLAELGDGRAHVLEPDVTGFGRTAAIAHQLEFQVAEVLGRRDDFARRRIDPTFKPVLWTVGEGADGPLFVANTAEDLDRLAVIGRRSLAVSGIRADDRVLLVDGHGSLPHWQFVLGCRSAGVAVLPCDLGTAVERAVAARPTVLAGPARAVRKVLDACGVDGLRTLAVDGTDATGDVHELRATGLPVAEWWAPAPVRAAWVRCPAGDGFHGWPEDELVEVVDGRLVWSAIGWHGSVWLRVDTGIEATVVDGPCPACGRTTPRVVPT